MDFDWKIFSQVTALEKKLCFFGRDILEKFISHKSCSDISSENTVQFHSDFTGMISTKCSCVFYCILESTSDTNLVRTTPQKLLVWFHPNFTEIINTKSSWACCQHFLVQWFFTELLSFNDFLILMFVPTTPSKLLMQSSSVVVHTIDILHFAEFIRIMAL